MTQEQKNAEAKIKKLLVKIDEIANECATIAEKSGISFSYNMNNTFRTGENDCGTYISEAEARKYFSKKDKEMLPGLYYLLQDNPDAKFEELKQHGNYGWVASSDRCW